MAVYVDDMKAPYKNMIMSHMIADTTEELIAMAKTIGVKEKWIQFPNTPKEHFDICQKKKELAIQNGAILVTWRQLGNMVIERKNKK